MLQIILLIVGIVALSQKSIKLTNKKELRKPQSIYLGIFLILWAALTFFIDLGSYGPLLFVIPLFVAIASTFFAKEIEVNKEEEKTEE